MRASERAFVHPQIDDQLAVVVHGHRRPDLAVLLEVGGEHVPHSLEAVGHGPVHLDAHPLLPCGRRSRRHPGRRGVNLPSAPARGHAGADRHSEVPPR